MKLCSTLRVAPREHPIWHGQVIVNVQIERSAEPLGPLDGAALHVSEPELASPFALPAEDLADEDTPDVVQVIRAQRLPWSIAVGRAVIRDDEGA
jgi:hypothetical protein